MEEKSSSESLENLGYEIWKDIDGYDGIYQISNQGRVRSLKKWDVNKRSFVDCVQILNPTDNGNGYLIVGLRIKTIRKNYYVHRLVAEAFVEKKEGKNVVNHLDYDKRNNRAENLEWCTQKENTVYSSHRMRKPRTSAKLGATNCRYIYERNGRYRICINRKEYPSCLTIEEAIKKRDQIIREVGYV